MTAPEIAEAARRMAHAILPLGWTNCTKNGHEHHSDMCVRATALLVTEMEKLVAHEIGECEQLREDCRKLDAELSDVRAELARLRPVVEAAIVQVIAWRKPGCYVIMPKLVKAVERLAAAPEAELICSICRREHVSDDRHPCE